MQKGNDTIAKYNKGEFCPWGMGGLPDDVSFKSVKQSIAEYLSVRQVFWSANTRSVWKPIFEQFVDIIGPDVPMNVLTQDMIQAPVAGNGYSWYTAEKYKGRINSWLKWAYEKKQTPRLLQAQNMVRKHEKRVSYITWDELQLVKQAIARDARHTARKKHCNPGNTLAWLIRFLDFMFLFGLRRQEALDVRVKDVDVQYKIIMIRNTKGARDESIPYGDVEQAKRIIDRQMFRLKRAGLLHPERRLFLHSQGDRVSKAFKKYVRRALPAHRQKEIKMHSIRHGTATYLLQYMSLSEVQAWMRHQDTRTTTGYAKIIQKNLSRQAGQALNRLR